MRREIVPLVEGDLSPATAAHDRRRPGPDDAPYPRLLEHLSTYVDAASGAIARRRRPTVPAAASARRRSSTSSRRAPAIDRVRTAVELGCSVGRVVAELAAGAGIEVSSASPSTSARSAARAASSRAIASHTTVAPPAVTTRPRTSRPAIAPSPPERVTWVCGDALDPPLLPGAFGRVVALNVVDSVSTPRQLLAVLDGLCAPGGEIILASPYAWQTGIVAETERIGGADPAADVTAILRDGAGLAGSYVIEDEAELPWTLRRDARSAATYCIHYVRARRR